MRRKDREVTDFPAILEIIEHCDILRLGLADGAYPYIVPVNFAYEVRDGQLSFYIHGAMAGRKYEMLRRNPVCSFEMDNSLYIEQQQGYADASDRKKVDRYGGLCNQTDCC